MNPDQIKPSAFTQQWKIGKPAQMICSDTIMLLWLLSWLGIMTMFQMRKYLDLIHRIFLIDFTKIFVVWRNYEIQFMNLPLHIDHGFISFKTAAKPSIINQGSSAINETKCSSTKCIWNQIHWLQVLKKNTPGHRTWLISRTVESLSGKW